MSDPYVRPEVRKFLDYVNALPGQKAFELPLAEARNLLHASRHVADAEVGELAVIRNLEMTGPDGGPLRLRLYDAREERGPGPLIVFYHGGGFVLGDLDTHEPFCAELARLSDLPVVAVDYRLAPEHPWPAGVEDAVAAARWLATSPAELGRQATGLVTCGDSAAAIWRSSLRSPCAMSPPRCRCSRNGRSTRPPTRQILSQLPGIQRKVSAEPGQHGLV
jgi:acetyl esterase